MVNACLLDVATYSSLTSHTLQTLLYLFCMDIIGNVVGFLAKPSHMAIDYRCMVCCGDT